MPSSIIRAFLFGRVPDAVLTATQPVSAPQPVSPSASHETKKKRQAAVEDDDDGTMSVDPFEMAAVQWGRKPDEQTDDVPPAP
jgi:hypothetical protein